MKEYDIEEFKKKFPHLAKELEEGVGVRRIKDLVEETPPYLPSAVDYLRRCHSLEEALEVLEYLVRTGQISEDEGRELKDRVLKDGLESLGPRKNFGYYSEKFLKNLDLKALQRRLP